MNVMGEFLQGGKTEHESNRHLNSWLHLNVPEQDSGEQRQSPVGDNRNSREEEANATVQLEVASTLRLPPKGCNRMTDVGCGDDEDDTGHAGHDQDRPNSPHESTARIGDTEESDTDASLDRYRASRVEELGDKEKLFPSVVSFEERSVQG